eukprot:EC713559.1.p2 GENE.EC713559.1~~EC713559.1.p2  ORF type:complete len:64 (+),score=2.67 EC713559.1:174-365(+)
MVKDAGHVSVASDLDGLVRSPQHQRSDRGCGEGTGSWRTVHARWHASTSGDKGRSCFVAVIIM